MYFAQRPGGLNGGCADELGGVSKARDDRERTIASWEDWAWRTKDPLVSKVRRVYSRSQFEKACSGGSRGITYVIRPTSKKLPADTARC